jgi:hypothetical protein
MPNERCPLCGQPLPEALTTIQITDRLQKLALPAVAEERGRLQEEFDAKLTAEREVARQRAEKALKGELLEAKRQAEKAKEDAAERLKQLSKRYEGQLEREKAAIRREAERASQAKIDTAERRAESVERELTEKLEAAKQSAKREAERDLRAKISTAERRAETAERELAEKLATAKETAKRDVERMMKDEVRKATELNERKLEKLQGERERERHNHLMEQSRLQGQLDNLSRKLEKRSGEELGEEGEVDLCSLLKNAFPEDHIERIGRGVKGADVVQQVMSAGNALGRIIFESKNVLVWQNAFVEQAEKYRTRYETPYVLIVSRVFPRKEKDFCIAGGIPVVRPRMAVALAQIIRDGIIEIGNLRLAGAGRDQKGHQLLEYIVSDRFGTRFKEIVDSAGALREQQQKERNWHENAWEYRSSLHSRIEDSHRGIEAQIKAVLTTPRPVAVAAATFEAPAPRRHTEGAPEVLREHAVRRSHLGWALANRSSR